ncbi:MAG: calcium-translocating P-type ATPase, PMCA-type [Nitrospirae bacterium]|nr:calcium-translocating P-type ATPase, PMCA-type [Nitrospirota bacterium]
MEEKTKWYKLSIEETLKELKSSPEGLSTEEAKARLNTYGPNELIKKKKKGPIRMFFDQFKDFMIVVLIAAAVLSGIIGDLKDTIAIAVILLLNAVLGFVQEYRAEKAMEALKKLSAPLATVIRQGRVTHVKASELVPGDIVLLEAGTMVPADIRLMEVYQLKIEEAALTGESLAVKKHVSALVDDDLPLGDRKNMAFKGTVVTYGRGKGVVVATGMDTELGRIATMLQESEEPKTPLQKRLAAFGKRLAIAIILICTVIFLFGILRGEPVLLMLLTAVSLTVAAIPEALPAVVTISLAIGARKMVKQNALIRKLPAVESLGSVTYICTDKTGTLTENRMKVVQIYLDGKIIDVENNADVKENRDFLLALALSNDVQMGDGNKAVGEPTELALYEFAAKLGFDKFDLLSEYPRVNEIPFDSDRKAMTTIHKTDSGYISFTKGAADVLIEKSTSMALKGEIDETTRDVLLKMNEKMASEGLRVLAIGMRRFDSIPEDLSPEYIENDLVFLGLVGLMDPPRKEVFDAIEACKKAGIVPVMITGDHPVTARTIALKLGLITEENSSVITGAELERLSEEEFKEKVEHIRVYARVAPEQKLKIVKALQDRGHFVAMTGDGVNDAPALKRADIGVAMGITGTDVAKEAAHMILLDDNFATIVKAVKEGRKIYDNIRKFIKYLLATNSAEVWTLFLAPFLALPLPLLPIHILWINLITDGLPAISLSAEPEEGDIMNRKPRPPRESIFAHRLGIDAIWIGLLMALLVLALQHWELSRGNENWQTMVFSTLCFAQLFNVLSIRTEKESAFSRGLFSNKPLVYSVLFSVLMQFAVIYLPVMNNFFRTSPLSLRDLAVVLGLSSLVFFIVEFVKMLRRKKSK